MTFRIYTFQISIFFLFFLTKGFSQSIGYSFSYTLPFEKINSIRGIGPFAEYERNSEYTIGLYFNNYNKLVRSIYTRLSYYSASMIDTRGTFVSFGTESNVRKFSLELESYFWSLSLYRNIDFSFGSKFSLLLRSTHDSFLLNTDNSKTVLTDIPFEGLSRFKWDILLRISGYQFQIAKSIFLQPSYTLCYEFSNDFQTDNLSSRGINHRFELLLSKTVSRK